MILSGRLTRAKVKALLPYMKSSFEERTHNQRFSKTLSRSMFLQNLICSTDPHRQVYQELLDLVKEEEIKEEKRQSQLICASQLTKDGLHEGRLSLGSNGSESLRSESSSGGSSVGEDRASLNDLYAVPRKKRNRIQTQDTAETADATEGNNGPRLPPRRVKSSYTRDPDWVRRA